MLNAMTVQGDLIPDTSNGKPARFDRPVAARSHDAVAFLSRTCAVIRTRSRAKTSKYHTFQPTFEASANLRLAMFAHSVWCP